MQIYLLGFHRKESEHISNNWIHYNNTDYIFTDSDFTASWQCQSICSNLGFSCKAIYLQTITSNNVQIKRYSTVTSDLAYGQSMLELSYDLQVLWFGCHGDQALVNISNTWSVYNEQTEHLRQCNYHMFVWHKVQGWYR